MKNTEYDIIIFRHGETDWNRENRLQGQTPTSLNQIGREQAKRLAIALEPEKPEIIFSSDLPRAKETSEMIGNILKIDIAYHSGLREINLGSAQGCLESEIAARFGKSAFLEWNDSDPKSDGFRFPNGESKLEAESRFIQTLFRLVESHPDKRIAVCSHGFLIRRLERLLGKDIFRDRKIPNCEVLKFRLLFENRNEDTPKLSI